MTVKDLKKLLDDKDDDVVIVFRDCTGGWCNLENSIDTYHNVIVLNEETNTLFDD